MASASTEPVATEVPERDLVARLEAELERSERRREAAEQWAGFLEAELEARDDHLEDIIVQYERKLEEARRTQTETGDGLLARLANWF